MPRIFKKSHRYNIARNCFVAKVILLDNTTIEFNLLPEVTGADCLEKVAQVVDIEEVRNGRGGEGRGGRNRMSHLLC